MLGAKTVNTAEIGTLRKNRDEILQHLLHANLRLQEYDQQRTNFIARAVHDFRAPLTAIAGFCGLLADGELGPLTAVQQEAIDRMRQSVKRISGMASAMFDLSTAPRLSRKPDLKEADILEPIRQALHEVTPVAREKRVDLRSDKIIPSPSPLYFESTNIEQVLVNLLDNACKFVPKNGFIEIRGYPYFLDRRKLWSNTGTERRQQTSQAHNCYRVDIMDNGPGVPVELLESIFEEYTSYSGAHDRSGGGLGLAICRWIVNRHGGQVWAETTPAGTTFSFVLPFRSSAGVNDADASR
jgi:signal transduction histidine kinase